MVIDLGLSAARTTQLIRLLHTVHIIRVNVTVQTLQGQYRTDLSPYLMDGQVNVRAGEQVTRSADLTLFDPFQRIQIDPDDPSPLAVGMADLVQVVYAVIDPQTYDHFDIPLFTGPIDQVSRDSTSVKITCVGKESLAVNNSYVGRIFRKGVKKTDVIRDILVNTMGENSYQIPDLDSRIPNDLLLAQGTIPWDTVKSLAASMGYQVFYDGRGTCRMRVRSGVPVWTFDDYWLSSRPEIDWSTDEIINTVIVKGGTPKKAKTNVSYTATAPANHPLSAARLGRNGVPRYLYETIEDSSLMSSAECQARANQRLSAGLLNGFSARWDGLPVPLLEEGDAVAIRTSSLSTNAVLNDFSIPLTIGTASYGYTRKVGQRGGQRGISKNQYAAYRKKSGVWAAQVRAAQKKAKKAAAARKKHRQHGKRH